VSSEGTPPPNPNAHGTTSSSTARELNTKSGKTSSKTPTPCHCCIARTIQRQNLATTPSGLEPRKWIGRVIELYKAKGITNGPVFQDRFSHHIKAGRLETKFFEWLEQVQET